MDSVYRHDTTVGDGPLRVLLLSKYGRSGASSRVRSYQYLPELQNLGITAVVKPLFDDEYLHDLYSGRRRSIKRLAASYGRRIVHLSASQSCDLLWIESEILPWLPATCEAALRYMRKPFVVDYDDAIAHFHFDGREALLARWRDHKIGSVMRHATEVIVANQFLADYAIRAGAQRVTQLPSAVDLNRYCVIPRRWDGVFRIGWIGTPVTARYLQIVKPALAEVEKMHPVRFVMVGGKTADLGPIPTEFRPWAEDSEVADLQSVDVGIMPLPEDDLARGKSGYKLIQYMGCGLPVVASPVGANVDIVEDGVTGFLASSISEWVNALDKLCRNPPMRSRMGMKGRQEVEARFSVQVLAPRLAKLLIASADQSPDPLYSVERDRFRRMVGNPQRSDVARQSAGRLRRWR